MSVWLAAFDPDLFEPCLRDVYSKHTAKVGGASLKAAEGILDAAEGEAATGAAAGLRAGKEEAAKVAGANLKAAGANLAAAEGEAAGAPQGKAPRLRGPQPAPEHADATLRRQLAVAGVLREAKSSRAPLSFLTRQAHRIVAFTERREAWVASLAKTYALGISLALGAVNNEIRNRFLWLDAQTEASYPGDDPEQFAKWNLFELDAFIPFSGLRSLVGASVGGESQQQEVVGEHLLPTNAHCTKCSSGCCTDSICSNGLCIPCCMDVG